KGEGIPADGVQSYMWFDLAFKQGNMQAKTAIDSLTPQLTKEQIDQAKKLSDGYSAKFQSLASSAAAMMKAEEQK
ncbi:MAG TPA: hypothetical protein PKV72_03790, partial [Candidatus Peribacteria bacterium]|nr:hypothetical protein [Candidatus Peribacteria bacterium]